MAPRETCPLCGSRAINSAPPSQRPGLLTTEKHMRVSPTVASSPEKVCTSPHDASVGRQPLLNALRRHWPEYVMEGIELGLYMIAACAFVVLLQYPTSPAHQAFPDPAFRRALIGLAWGGIHLLSVGQGRILGCGFLRRRAIHRRAVGGATIRACSRKDGCAPLG